MRRLLPLVPLLLAGCVTVPPAPNPREYLASLTKGASPIRREQNVGGRAVILSAYGADLLREPVQGELAKVIKHRRAEGLWPEVDELSAGGERWRVARVDDLLVLTRTTDAELPYPEVFVSPDGFIGLDISYRKFIPLLEFGYLCREFMSPPPASGHGTTFPPVIILPRHF